MKSGGRKHGFTIVELLIVIVVIAILAAIAVVAYTGIQSRAYTNRASSELAAIARAVQLYHADRGSYPPDADRNIPVAIFDYSGNDTIPTHWPQAPWPGSVYDYDFRNDPAGAEYAQVSIRFCPLEGTIDDCQFPREPWAEDFNVNSSAYWCITGACRAHPTHTAPGHCLNCKDN